MLISSLYVSMANTIQTPCKFIIAKLSIRKLGSSPVQALK